MYRLLVVLMLPLVAASAPAPRSEARLYCREPAELRAMLGTLLGELDVCTHGRAADGRHYLVVNATPGELQRLRESGAEIEVTWPDIRDKFRAVTGCEPNDAAFRDFGYFFNYWELRDTLVALATRYPTIASLDSSMRSFQNRPLYCLKVSDNPEVEEGEPQCFFNGATHAREPLGTHTCVAFASLLCLRYGIDSLTTWLVNNREIYFVPVMNPDGYVYNSDSGGVSSNWRKNRRIIQSPYVGVDLNRNYGYKWAFDNSGSSPNPGSETYRGPARFSEPAVAAIGRFESLHRFRTQIDFHTYGRYNMYPWAYVGSAPPEQALLQEIVDTFQVNNSYPNTGQWYYVLYPSNGASIDYELSDTAGKFVTYAFSCELGINDFWYGWNDPTYVDNEINLNIPNCYYLTRLAGAFLEPAGMTVSDTASGNGNGRLDPGETAGLWFRLNNRALHALDSARDISVSLLPADTLVRVLTPSARVPDLPRRTIGDNRAEPIVVRCSPDAAPGANISLRLVCTFTDAGLVFTQPVPFRITIGNDPVAVCEPTTERPARALALAVVPNPVRERAVFSVVTPPGAAPTALTVFSRDGRLVRTVRLPDSGQRQIVWDSSDDSGRRLPDGIYFARLEAGCQAALVKLALSRW